MNSSQLKKYSWIRDLPFLSILTGIYIIVFYLKVGDRIPFFATIRLEFLIGSFLLVMAFFIRPQLHKVSSENLSTLTIWFIAILGIYTIFSFDQETSIFVFKNHVIKYAALTLFIAVFCRTTSSLKFFIVCLFIAWLKLGQEGFAGWITGSMVWFNQGIPRLHGPVGQLGHPNSFSGFAVGTLPFILYLYPLLKKHWQKLTLLVMLAFSTIIIIATGSRTGYVATVLFLIYFMFGLKINKMKTFLIMLLVCMSALMVIPDSYKGRFESIFTQQEVEGNSSGTRRQILEDAWKIYTQYPLGIGVGAFPAVRMEVFGRHQNTHNLYLEILTNTGPLGLILFILLIMKILSINKKNIRKNNELIASIKGGFPSENGSIDSVLMVEIEERQFLIAISKAVIGFILVRLLLGLFGMDLYEIYWWLAIGLTLSVNVITSQHNTKKSFARRRSRL